MADKELDAVVGEIRERLKKISELYSDVLERFHPVTPTPHQPQPPIMENIPPHGDNANSRYR